MAAQPHSGSATVDGATGDWSLGADFFANMTDAGHANAAVRAKLYLKYDCDSEKLFALVLAQNGEQVRQKRTDEAYIMIDGKKIIDSAHGQFACPPPAIVRRGAWSSRARRSPTAHRLM